MAISKEHFVKATEAENDNSNTNDVSALTDEQQTLTTNDLTKKDKGTLGEENSNAGFQGNQSNHKDSATVASQSDKKSEQKNIKSEDKDGSLVKKKTVLYSSIGVVLGLLVGVGFAFAGSALFSKDKEKQDDKQATVARFEPKKIDKLPVPLPKDFKGDVKEVLDFGEFYLFGATYKDGDKETPIEYMAITKSGKFTLLGLVVQSETGEIIYNAGGRYDSAKAQEQAQQQEAEISQANQSKGDDEVGDMPKAYHEADLTKAGEFTFDSKFNADGQGKISANPDSFSRIVADVLYNSMLHSDSMHKVYKNSPHTPVYVFYDPRCPHCQKEIPKFINAQKQGYDIIFVPTGALSAIEDLEKADNNLVSQVLLPSLGGDDLINTLVKSKEYQAKNTFSADELENNRKIMIENTKTFIGIANAVQEEYKDAKVASPAVPTAFWIDRKTGKANYTNLDDAEINKIFGKVF